MALIIHKVFSFCKLHSVEGLVKKTCIQQSTHPGWVSAPDLLLSTPWAVKVMLRASAEAHADLMADIPTVVF